MAPDGFSWLRLAPPGQKDPGVQEELGARRNQKKPERARRSQEDPGGGRESQEEPGGPSLNFSHRGVDTKSLSKDLLGPYLPTKFPTSGSWTLSPDKYINQ